MSVEAIVTALVVVEERVAGIKKAFDLPPDGDPAPLPCFINIVDDGDVATPRMPGAREWDHRIQAIALVAYSGRLADAERVARPLIHAFTAALDEDKTLGGQDGVIEAAVARYRKDNVVLRRGDDEAVSYVGVVFDVVVKEIETGVSYS